MSIHLNKRRKIGNENAPGHREAFIPCITVFHGLGWFVYHA